MTSAPLDPDAAIDRLGLEPHPEGGWFAETWRDRAEDGGRGSGTAIYFLLRTDEASHWHRVDATEIWHHYAGGPLLLSIATADDGPVTEIVLGPDLAAGQRPQAIVPAGAWQAARPIDGAVLVGCTVSPAFTFDAFELAPPGWSPGQG
ncbi:MAG: cupin domain-containing protein [Acidimicrobiales bacterium]|nr:cupin domain-containing protein [Acidimicrobiales bacterium]